MAGNVIKTVDLPADVAPGAMGLLQLSDVFQRAGYHKLAGYLRRCGDVVAVQDPSSDSAPLPMGAAPRDGTTVRLLVSFTNHALHDTPSGEAWTIGHNSHDNTGDDEWQFAGWSWEQDCYTSGEGTPIGWLPLPELGLQATSAEVKA